MGPAAPELVTLGETMGLVRCEHAGPLGVGSPARVSFAGAESTVAIGVSRLGRSAAWVGRVGQDSVGAMVVAGLRAESVDTSHVVQDPQAGTGLLVREHRTADRVRVGYWRRGSAGSRLGPGDVPEAAVAAAAVLHLSGITLAISPTARAAVLRAVEVARAAGVRVSLDVNYRSLLWSRAEARAVLGSLLPHVDLLFAGREEAALVLGDETGGTPVEAGVALERLGALGPGEVVLTLGAQGAVAAGAGGGAEAAAVPVTPVDPVGAGDAFVAGYLAATLDGASLGERLRLGTACGAFAVSTAGDWEGLPRRDELALLAGADDVVR